MKRRLSSDFHDIRIRDTRGVRSLEFGGTVQSTMAVDGSADASLEYVDFFHLAAAFRPLRRVLFIGLGGASAPRQFLEDYPEVDVDCVEIDPQVVHVAREFFRFSESERCRIHIADGAEFVERSRDQWEAIVVDAYETVDEEPHIPEQLASAPFFGDCAERLTRDGLLVINCAAPPGHHIVSDIVEELGALFRFVVGFEAISSDNIVLIASRGRLPRRAPAIAERVSKALDAGTLRRDVLVRRARQVARLS